MSARKPPKPPKKCQWCDKRPRDMSTHVTYECPELKKRRGDR